MYWAPAVVGFGLVTIGWLVLWMQSRVMVSSAFKKARWVWCLAVYFLLYLVLQSGGWILGLQSIEPHATWSQLIKSWMMFQVFGLTTLLVTSHKRVRSLAWTLLLAGTFQAVYGSIITLTDTDMIWWRPKEYYRDVATGTFINRNHLAGYLEMTLAIGIGLMIASLDQSTASTWRERTRRIVATLLGPKLRIRVCLALMVIGLILTRSRMGNTAFFASMLAAGFIGLILFRRSGKGVLTLFGSLIVIDIFLMGAFFGLDKVQDRLLESSTEEQRFEAARLTFEIFKDHLWTGTGFGSFYSAFVEYRTESITLYYDHAHNDYAEFASELGILGLWPLAAIWIMSFYWAIRVQIERKSQLMKAMGFSSTMAMIAIGIHSTTDFNLQISSNAATFMVILALPYVAYCVDRREVSSPRKKSMSSSRNVEAVDKSRST
tara:strand:+ start:106386 stop:107684 length:1299 start_codon:yes stop_codon:yes gene_type:complete